MPGPAPAHVDVAQELLKCGAGYRVTGYRIPSQQKAVFHLHLNIGLKVFPLASDIKGVEAKQGCVDWVNTVFSFYHLLPPSSTVLSYSLIHCFFYRKTL